MHGPWDAVNPFKIVFPNAVADHYGVCGRIVQGNERAITVTQLSGRLRHPLHDRVEVQGGVDIARQGRHYFCLTALSLGLRKEASIFQRQPCLVGKGLQQRDLSL